MAPSSFRSHRPHLGRPTSRAPRCRDELAVLLDVGELVADADGRGPAVALLLDGQERKRAGPPMRTPHVPLHGSPPRCRSEKCEQHDSRQRQPESTTGVVASLPPPGSGNAPRISCERADSMTRSALRRASLIRLLGSTPRIDSVQRLRSERERRRRDRTARPGPRARRAALGDACVRGVVALGFAVLRLGRHVVSLARRPQIDHRLLTSAMRRPTACPTHRG